MPAYSVSVIVDVVSLNMKHCLSTAYLGNDLGGYSFVKYHATVSNLRSLYAN